MAILYQNVMCAHRRVNFFQMTLVYPMTLQYKLSTLSRKLVLWHTYTSIWQSQDI